ncbi:MAG: hypothetical protein K9W42_07700 [Candidatus Heimdallarchaeota archaeon]|nr:hypothetical protein [Candidatus Heimdallarchaeota archaeon]
MNYRKILLATTGPIKAITIIWGFLILIIAFIYYLFFNPEGLLNIAESYPVTFRVINVIISAILFLYWLIVWNILAKAFFREDLDYSENNGLKLAKIDG